MFLKPSCNIVSVMFLIFFFVCFCNCKFFTVNIKKKNQCMSELSSHITESDCRQTGLTCDCLALWTLIPPHRISFNLWYRVNNSWPLLLATFFAFKLFFSPLLSITKPHPLLRPHEKCVKAIDTWSLFPVLHAYTSFLFLPPFLTLSTSCFNTTFLCFFSNKKAQPASTFLTNLRPVITCTDCQSLYKCLSSRYISWALYTNTMLCTKQEHSEPSVDQDKTFEKVDKLSQRLCSSLRVFSHGQES